MTDAKCVGLSVVRQPDRTLLEEMYRAHHSDAIRFVARRCAHTGIDPEDIVQSAFERLATQRALSSRADVVNARAFLLAVVLNVMRDHFRQRRAQAGLLRSLEQSSLLTEIDELTPEQVTTARQSLAIIDETLARLPSLWRRLFLETRLEGRTIRDVADAHNVPKTTAHEIVATTTRKCSRALDGRPEGRPRP